MARRPTSAHVYYEKIPGIPFLGGKHVDVLLLLFAIVHHQKTVRLCNRFSFLPGRHHQGAAGIGIGIGTSTLKGSSPGNDAKEYGSSAPAVKAGDRLAFPFPEHDIVQTEWWETGSR
jgi:hypothetical protein